MNKTKLGLGILAVLLLIGALLATTAAPVLAAGTVNVYTTEGSDVFWYDGGPHYVVYYKIPHRAVQFPLLIAESFIGPTQRPIVKGIDYSVVNTLTDHKDPQNGIIMRAILSTQTGTGLYWLSLKHMC